MSSGHPNHAASLWVEDARYLLALARDVLIHHHTNYEGSALATHIDDFLIRGVSPQLPVSFTLDVGELEPRIIAAGIEDLL